PQREGAANQIAPPVRTGRVLEWPQSLTDAAGPVPAVSDLRHEGPVVGGQPNPVLPLKLIDLCIGGLRVQEHGVVFADVALVLVLVAVSGFLGGQYVESRELRQDAGYPARRIHPRLASGVRTCYSRAPRALFPWIGRAARSSTDPH